MNGSCRGCEYLFVKEASRITDRQLFCTHFPRKKREIKNHLFRGRPRWCPKLKIEEKEDI